MGDRYYFSNGTEGRMWSERWCERCVNDHCTHNADPDFENGCQHIALMCVGEDVPEIIETDEDAYPFHLTCIDFRRCSCDNGPDDPPGEPLPPPPDPNQGKLFEPADYPPGVTRAAALDAWPVPVSEGV